MSFVRFGSDGSQVYIYDDIAVGPRCCYCALAKTWLDEAGNTHWADFTTRDLDAMLAHIAEHRAAGHVVPDWVDQALRDEWEGRVTERESYHAQPRAVDAIGYVVPISTEMLLEAEATRSAMQRWMSATPEERAEWAAEQGRKRAEERAAAERMPLTLDALIDKLGWSREYAEHFAQPYCYCEDGRDGWEYCPHARDEGLTP